MKIAVAGVGYVGLSLAVLLAQHHQVQAVSTTAAKVDLINHKNPPFRMPRSNPISPPAP